MIKLQQIKVHDGGYISDGEEEDDDPSSMFKNFNYNYNYFRGKNSMHIHRPPKMAIDKINNRAKDPNGKD